MNPMTPHKRTLLMPALMAALLCALNTATAQTMDQVVSQIMQNNVHLQANERNVQAEISTIKMQNNLGATMVSYSPFYANGVHGIASSELVVSQDFDFPTLYALRSRLGRQQTVELQSRLQAMQNDVRLEARTLCLTLIHQHKLAEVLQLRTNTMQNLVNLYEKKMQQGAATVIELNKVRLETMQQKAELQKCLSAIATTETLLKALNAGKDITLGVHQYPAKYQLPDDETIVAQYVANDMTAQADVRHTQAMNHKLTISRNSWLPSLSVGYRRNTSLEEKSHGFRIGAAVPLFSNANRTRAAKARYESALATAQQTRIAAEAEIRKQLAQMHNIRKSMDAYDVPLMQDAMTALTKACTQGEITAIDYCRETRDITAQLQTYLTLERDYHLCVAKILKNYMP